MLHIYIHEPEQHLELITTKSHTLYDKCMNHMMLDCGFTGKESNSLLPSAKYIQLIKVVFLKMSAQGTLDYFLFRL